MKKRSKIQKSSRKLTAGETDDRICEEKEKKLPGSRGRPRKTTSVNSSCNVNSLKDAKATDGVQNPTEAKFRSSGRLSTAICRLCHGKFSPRSLRHAFQWPQDVVEEELDAAAQSPPLLFHTFHVDFQQLVGVPLDRDPRLSEFVCKKCHTKFYKCHSILIRFLQRVNLPPVGKENHRNQKAPNCPDSSLNHCSTAPPCFTSDPKCLHSLVSWAHHHGEACRSCPNLKEVMGGQCLGSVKAVWSCVDGHRYTMDTQQSAATNLRCTLSISGGGLGRVSGDGVVSEEDEQQVVENEEDRAGGGIRTARGSLNTPSSNSPPAVALQTQSSEPDHWSTNSKGSAAPVASAAVQLEGHGADSEMSDRVISDDDFDEPRKEGASDDELFEPYSNTRPRRAAVSNKRPRIQQVPEEPKIRKKPGPKPGWKNKFKPKREELPNIYKCPYQGCTAVYKSPDVRKKHIKEHHEEVRERPCPHPGCNKVFTIDRYLQRHIKAIHTEERNYICDQCGQTFKQRKHLFVHQLRHSGAKPLQCEVCGFQCRQRASLKYHMTKHKAEADLEFACLICKKRFEKAHNLNVHMSMIHPLTQAKSGGGSKQQQQQQQQQQLPPPPQQQQQQQQLQPQQQQPLYDLHTVTQQDQDR